MFFSIEKCFNIIWNCFQSIWWLFCWKTVKGRRPICFWVFCDKNAKIETCSYRKDAHNHFSQHLLWLHHQVLLLDKIYTVSNLSNCLDVCHYYLKHWQLLYHKQSSFFNIFTQFSFSMYTARLCYICSKAISDFLQKC